MNFLPVSADEISDPDFVLVTGDAYVDHPSFGAAIIGRMLESHGYKVAVLPQPDWRDKLSFQVFGRPRLGFLVTSGNIDSMVNHYTAAKKRRKNDMYSPDGKAGLRPDRATIVYSQKIREAYGDVPIILGGLEASLRRLGHYDYWDDKVRRSVLIDSGADLIIYGMGERPIIDVAEALSSGLPVSEITFINGTVYKTRDLSRVYDYITLPTFKEIAASKEKYAQSFQIQYKNSDYNTAKVLVESCGGFYVVQNTPPAPLATGEMDNVYGLKYMRTFHPMYKYVPAIEEVKFSITSSRGCFGNCSFCAIGFHQGGAVQSRSHKSILREAEDMTHEGGFKGYIHDVGGPTANFRQSACDNIVCGRRRCLFPTPCKKLNIDHTDYLSLLRNLRALRGVKKVFIRSGIRYDYLIYDKDDSFFKELCEHHISGQLKVAPEHVSRKVLEKMGKPGRDVYDRFVEKFYEINKKLGKEQYLVPYLMSGHPGSGLAEAVELAEYLRDTGVSPEQVQDFYPTPGTLSTAMYYTGIDPRTMEKVYVPKKQHEKAMQRALLQYRLPQNYDLVAEALKAAKREDLISNGKKGLIKPRGEKNKNVYQHKRGKKRSDSK